MEKSKIGLISYHYYHNYGTCLQAYALWKFLSDRNIDCEYINFNQCEYTEQISKHKGVAARLKEILRRVLFFNTFNGVKRTKQSFREFRKKYIVEATPVALENLSSIEDKYDKFIIGSDQTWNPGCISAEYFEAFLLNFVKNPDKKYSYAPSIGRSVVDENTVNLFQSNLASFKRISCREKNGCDMLADILDREIEKVVDPTLLFTKEEWKQFAQFPLKNEKYVFCYILGNKECVCDFAEKLAKEKNLSVYYLSYHSNILRKNKKPLSGIGPREFLGLILNASYVVTDSFHGSIFSINFQVNFYSFTKRQGGVKESDNIRVLEALGSFNLLNRFKEDGDYSLEEDIDFSGVTPLLETQRQASFDYLYSIINQ